MSESVRVKWIARGPDYQKQLALQLKLWLDAEPHHLGDPKDKLSECCPDFSCCNPDLLVDAEVRQAFCDSDVKHRDLFFATFLKRLLAHKGFEAHVSGDKLP